MKVKRVYHFLSAQYGLEDLKHKSLKISRIHSLNDPFELLVFSLTTPEHRRKFTKIKREMTQNHGLLCFSLTWANPLLWSHYGDRHRGLALGFDVQVGVLHEVKYVKDRPLIKEINEETARQFLFTKYFDWNYEREARIYTRLDEPEDNGLYFYKFNEQFALREIIVGPLSIVRKKDIREAIGSSHMDVEVTKSRLAFQSYQVVRDKRGLK